MAGCVGIAAGATAQPHASDAVEFEGRCAYSDRLAPLIEQGHIFAECDRMIMRHGSDQFEIEFAFPARLRSIALRGTFAEPDEFAVSAIQLRSQREWKEAEGRCEFAISSGEYRVVTCVVKSGARFYVTNFERRP